MITHDVSIVLFDNMLTDQEIKGKIVSRNYLILKNFFYVNKLFWNAISDLYWLFSNFLAEVFFLSLSHSHSIAINYFNMWCIMLFKGYGPKPKSFCPTESISTTTRGFILGLRWSTPPTTHCWMKFGYAKDIHMLPHNKHQNLLFFTMFYQLLHSK